MNRILMVILALGLTAQVASAQSDATKTKSYLVLGANPQAKNRQPTSEEDVVVLDADICDSGWGTGTVGHKAAGCYAKGLAVIRNKKTHVLVAVYYCGNEPSDHHVVDGKAVPIELLLVQGPKGDSGATGAPGKAGQDFSTPVRKCMNVNALNFLSEGDCILPPKHEGGGNSLTGVLVGAGVALATIVVVKLTNDNHHEEAAASPPPSKPAICTDQRATNHNEAGACKYPPGVTGDSAVVNKPCSNGNGSSCLRASLVGYEAPATYTPPPPARSPQGLVTGFNVKKTGIEATISYHTSIYGVSQAIKSIFHNPPPTRADVINR